MEKMEFDLGTSFNFFILFSLLFLSAFIILWVSSLNYFLKFAISPLLVIQYIHILKIHVFRNHVDATILLWQDQKGAFGTQNNRGYKTQGKVQSQSLVSSWCIILRIKLKRKNQTILIPADALRENDFRILSARIILSKN